MNTIVSFEIAKLLLQRNFDNRCKKIYNSFGELWDSYYSYMINSNKDSGALCTAPTIADVVMWLYNNYGIWISILPRDREKWKFDIYTESVTTVYKINVAEHNSPTEAYNEAIKYVLNNLIK